MLINLHHGSFWILKSGCVCILSWCHNSSLHILVDACIYHHSLSCPLSFFLSSSCFSSDSAGITSNAMVDNILAPTIGYDSLPGPDSLEIMSETLSLTCISILATAFGFKTNNQRLSRLTYGQFLVLLLYMLSWAFCVTSMVVISTNDGMQQKRLTSPYRET